MKKLDKKILLITGSLNQGGAEYQILLLARLLQQKGHIVEVLALTDYPYYRHFVEKHCFNYSCISNKGNNLVRLIRALRKIINKNHDLAISFLKRPSQVSILARVLSGFRFKLIISERTSEIKPYHDIYFFALALLANRITVNSVNKCDYIIRRFPLLKNKTVFIPNIFDFEKFSTVKSVIPSEKSARLTYLGRISPEKNLINLIKAVSLLYNKGYNITLSLVGEAHDKKYYKEVCDFINKISLSKVVKYEGPTDNVLSLYENTDVLCLVSIYEGFSNVLAEALACGLIVVASNIEENKYLIEDKVNGFLINPNNVINIADTIEKCLLLNENDRIVISKKNRKKASLIFNNEKIYFKYAQLFYELL